MLGDARLTLAKEPDHAYDLIVVDAYSSDAIPVHLATREAMAIYKSKLAPHGVVMMHISNRHLELQSVVVGIAAANALQSWVWSNRRRSSDDDNYISIIRCRHFGREPGGYRRARARQDLGADRADPGLRTWTDDYSNIAGAFWRKLQQ